MFADWLVAGVRDRCAAGPANHARSGTAQWQADRRCAFGTAKWFLSDAEAGALFNWLPNLGRRVEDALTLYLWNATRGVEIGAREREEIAVEQDGLWWTISKARTKTKNARRESATDLRVPLIGRLFPGERPHGTEGGWPSYMSCSETRSNQRRSLLPVMHCRSRDLRQSPEASRSTLAVPHGSMRVARCRRRRVVAHREWADQPALARR